VRILSIYILSLLLFLFSNSLKAQHFDFNDRCKEAYHEVLRLQKSAAEELIKLEKAENPENLIPLLLEDYIDFLTVYLTEDESLLRKLEKNKAIRLAEFDKVADSDPYKKYAKSSVYLHWALARIKFEEYFTTATEIYRSYHLVESNASDFPDFKPNNLLLGLYETILGTVPANYAWATKLLGLNGSIEGGMNKVKAFRAWSESKGEGLYFDEANIFYIYLLAYIADGHSEAWKLCQNERDDPEHLMNVFLVSDIAYKSGNAGEAIDFISRAERNTKETIPFPFLDFMEGQLRLCELDQSAALYFEKYIAAENNVHYVKDALQRLAFTQLLNGDSIQCRHTMQRVAEEGALFFDCDKEALHTSKNKALPHVDLLKARLLFDGGNYTQALEYMRLIEMESLSEAHLLEYKYRYARIYEKMNMSDMALTYYQEVIDLGSLESKSYFPARSSLALGYIHEDKMKFDIARKYFKECMNYAAHPFTNSFEQQAKAGLDRIKNK